MPSGILVEKNGSLKEIDCDEVDETEYYKLVGMKRKSKDFKKHTTWEVEMDGKHYRIQLYGKDKGSAGQENKYDFPPPVDTPLYFGVCALVANDENDDCIDLSIEAWETFYEELFGGFENLADSIAEDENEEDELDNIAAEMKTKSGYLKDDFVVDDNPVDNSSNESDEEEFDDDSAELDLEEYSYSDEDESN